MHAFDLLIYLLAGGLAVAAYLRDPRCRASVSAPRASCSST